MQSHLLVPRGDQLPTRKAAVYGVGIGFMAFTSIVVLLRLWVRIFMLRALGTDDGRSSRTAQVGIFMLIVLQS